MIKIPTIFERDKNFFVTEEINPLCKWVFNNEGIAYRKWQGMAALIDGQKNYYKRKIFREDQYVPSNFILLNKDFNTGKRYGWLPVNIENPADVHYIEAYDSNLNPGTYELIGPSIFNNPEKLPNNILMSHKAERILHLKRTYEALKLYINSTKIEGIVFHHPDGRMAKIKGKDFNLTRN